MEDKKQICRICFEGEEDLISPCSCSGSIKWVHRSCLDKWRNQCRSSESEHFHNQSQRCEICHFYYLFDEIPESEIRRCLRRLFYAIFIYLEIIFHFWSYYQEHPYSGAIPLILLIPVGMMIHRKYLVILLALFIACVIATIFETKPENSVPMGMFSTSVSVMFFTLSEKQIQEHDMYVVRDLSKKHS
jgi:RING-variant domain